MSTEFLALGSIIVSTAAAVRAATEAIDRFREVRKLLKQTKDISQKREQLTQRSTAFDHSPDVKEKLSNKAKEKSGKFTPTFNALPTEKPIATATARLITACLLVAVVFMLSVGVVWCLTKIGGPITASVDSSVKKLGNSIVIAGTGPFAAFFAIALLGFLALHWFGKKK